MRLVDYDPADITISADWTSRANDLTKQLSDAVNAQERKEILRKNGIWSELGKELRKLSNGKCWYTESPQEGTDVDVDHFRPKRRVAERVGEDDGHPGYWWLAYDPRNYRYSCIYANRLRRDLETDLVGGKADRFPIDDEAARAMTPDSNWGAEKTLLIDPCQADEVALITFKPDGEAMARYPEAEAYKFKKASLSIKYYNLNHSDFRKARTALRDQIENLRIEAKRFYERLENGDTDHQAAYRGAIKQIRKMRDPSSPYSAFCVAITDAYRAEPAMDPVFL